MKRRSLMTLAAVSIVMLTALLMGCDLAGVTIESRIESFVSDLNNDRADAISNFHPVETSDYGIINGNPGFWDLDFPVGSMDYVIVAIDSSNSLDVLVTIDRPDSGLWPKNFSFVMLKDGATWYIEELWYSGAGNIVQ